MYSQGHSIRFKNLDEQDVWIKIYDTYSEDAFETTWHELTATGDPLHITTINNEEYKFTPIRAQQATIQFTSKNNATISHFLGGGENRFYVEITVDDTYTLFKGYLIVDDMAQPFLHPSNNLAVTLVATDNLGLLKDVDLSDFSGAVPRGKYPIIKYVAWCLRKTGLNLNIKVVNNIHEENSPGAPYMQSVFLDAKTFEAEVGEREDCYSVLEKILGEGNVLMQHNGAWWILRIDEVQGEPLTLSYQHHNFDSEGLYGGVTLLPIQQEIWKWHTSNFKFAGEVYVRATRPAKELTETYSYDYPKEIPDNVEFDRGKVYFPMAFPPGYTYYEIEDWTTHSGTGNKMLSNILPDPISLAYIVRRFEFDEEQERYVRVFTPASGPDSITWIKSSAIPVHKGDRLNVTADIAFEFDITSGDQGHFIYILLEGSDGKTYQFGENRFEDPSGAMTWYALSTNSRQRFTGLPLLWDAATQQETEWQSIGGDVNAFPVDGDMFVLLPSYPFATSAQNKYIKYQNLRVTYKPYINGSYQKYKGQTWTITNSEPDKYKKKQEGQVYISDSPKKLFKGAMFVANSFAQMFNGIGTMLGKVIQLNNVNIANQFFAGQFIRITESDFNDGDYTVASVSYVAPNTRIVLDQELGFALLNTQFVISKLVPGVFSLAGRFYNGFPEDRTKRAYGELQALNLWNQTNRVFRLFDFNTKGMTTLPSPLHPYRITQQGEHTLAKWFILLHMDQDWRRCEMSGTLAEVQDYWLPKTNDDKKAFKYITER